MQITGLTDKNFVHTVIRRRPKDVHKGSCGKVLIVAGSREMAGAAVFSSKAAIKCGSGLVNVCTRRKIFSIIQISVPESICLPWGKAKRNLAGYDAIAAGPGMGVDRRTREILKRILTEYAGTFIIDADGLNTIAKDAKLQVLLRSTKARVILTPHIGEAGRLLGKQIKGCAKEEIGQALWEKFHCAVIVKGADTLVALSGGDRSEEHTSELQSPS